MNQRAFRTKALSLCYAFLTAVITPFLLRAENPKTIPGEKVDRSVIAALSHQNVAKPRIISHIDLTETFGTATQWTFVAVQDGGQPAEDFEEHGPIVLCLVKAVSPDCALHLYQHVRGDMPWFDTPYHLFAGRVVYANPNKSSPLLFLKVCGAVSGDGDCGIATALYKYDRGSDHFIGVFQNLTGRNNNQATRFVESGPLQGDVIVNSPTENAPYTTGLRSTELGIQRSMAEFFAIAVSPATQTVIRWPWLILKCLKYCVAWDCGNPAIRCLFHPTCLRDAMIYLCGMVKNGASDMQGWSAR